MDVADLFKSGLLYIPLLLIGLLMMHCHSSSETTTRSYPSDLKIVGTSGGTNPWSENRSVSINNDGQGTFTRFKPGDIGAPPIEEQSFKLSPQALEQCWKTIESSDFFSLDTRYSREDVTGGSFVSLSVTAHQRTHSVTAQNIEVASLLSVIQAINEVIPDSLAIPTTGPDL